MRKISKFALLVVAGVSVVFLLFYKQQYDKLYNVLQVLEFFGNPEVFNNPDAHSSSLPWRPPAWQISPGEDKVSIYSAFCARTFDSSDLCPIVKIVALAPEDPDWTKVTCQLWYEGTIRPVMGMISAVPMSEPSKETTEGAVDEAKSETILSAFLFSCESKFSALQPFAVSISRQGQKGDLFTHIEPTEELIPLIVKDEISVTACIIPQTSRTDSTQKMLENIMLHSFFGISKFLLYDGGLTSKFVGTLSQSGVNVKILPWNLPLGVVSEKTVQILVETDCHLRTSSGSSSVIVLNPTQVLTPTSGSVTEVLKQPGMSGKLELDVLKFCAEFQSVPDWIGPNLVALQQNLYSKTLSSDLVLSMTHFLNAKSSVVKVPRALMSVHDYDQCGDDMLDPVPSDLASDSTFKDLAANIQTKIGKYFPRLKVDLPNK